MERSHRSIFVFFIVITMMESGNLVISLLNKRYLDTFELGKRDERLLSLADAENVG